MASELKIFCDVLKIQLERNEVKMEVEGVKVEEMSEPEIVDG